MSSVFYYLLACCRRRRHYRGVCASSAASAAACWHSSDPPAGQSQSSEIVDGTCPPTADWRPPLKVKVSGLMKRRKRRRKGPAPSGPLDQSLSQAGCYHRWPLNRGSVSGRSSMDSAFEGTWNYLWRERPSELWGCSSMSGWEESWSWKLCSN